VKSASEDDMDLEESFEQKNPDLKSSHEDESSKVSSVKRKRKTNKKSSKSTKSLKLKDRKMAGMISKWAAVQREAQDNGDDMDDYERRKEEEAQKVREWKQQQIETGAAVSNENFIPVSEQSWRQRVKKRKGKEADLGEDW